MNDSVVRAKAHSQHFAVLLFPLFCFAFASISSAQSNTAARGKYVVSVQDLQMATKGRAAFEKGSRLLERGETAASVAYLQQAIAEYPDHYLAFYDLGTAHFRLNQLSEAEQSFQKAIDITKGSYAPPQIGLGAVFCRTAQFSQAESVLQRALELEPGSAAGKYYLGWAQLGLNRLVQAEQTVQQALLRKANFAEAYLLLARVHRVQRNRPAVAADLEAYLKCEPRKGLARSMAEQIQRELEEDESVVAVAQAQAGSPQQ